MSYKYLNISSKSFIFESAIILINGSIFFNLIINAFASLKHPNNSLFGTTNGAGYTFVAFVKNATSGNIFRRGSDFTINLTGGEVRFTSLNNSALNVATSTAGWNMIAITNVGGVIKMYKNNVEIGSTTQTSSATNAVADIYLMENNNGELGAFLFYQRAISATEVGHIWNNLKGRFGL